MPANAGSYLLRQNYIKLNFDIMQEEEQTEQKVAVLGRYTLVRFLGEGATARVMLGAVTEATEQVAAVKIYKQGTITKEDIENEVELMSQLHHPNLVNMRSIIYKSEPEEPAVTAPSESLTVRPPRPKEIIGLAVEIVTQGELFDYVLFGGAFSEQLTRSYFKQLMDGLGHIHEKGYCHRDIKPQNLLLDSHYNLKIADFGYGTLLEGKQKDGILREKMGTEGYMAPQMYLLKYNGIQVDLFAAGVVLFVMLSAHPPFFKTTVTDPYYRLFKHKKTQIFWKEVLKHKPANFYSPTFMDLIERMLAFEPSERLTSQQIMEHPWMTEQPLLTPQQIREELSAKRHIIQEHRLKKKQEKEKKRNARMQAILNMQRTMKRGAYGDIDIGYFLALYESGTETMALVRFPLIKEPPLGALILRESQKVFLSALFTYLCEKVKLSFGSHEVVFTPRVDCQDDKLFINYEFDYQGYEEEVQLVLQLGTLSETKLCLSFSLGMGCDLYGKALIEDLKEEFSYCSEPLKLK